jgi:hypothetical protein
MNVPWKTLFVALLLLSFVGAAPAQTAAGTSAYDLNVLLAQLDQTAQTTNLDLAKLRIEKWKGGGEARTQYQSNADSLSRNISSALPAIVGGVRSAPDNLAANFKLYRNVDALYDVLTSLTEAASSGAPHSDYQALATDLSNLEAVRRALADRIEALAASRDTEVARLRSGGGPTAAKSGTSSVKKIVIDDNAPAKPSSTRKKKPTTKTSPQ